MQFWDQFKLWLTDLSFGSIFVRILLAVLVGTIMGVDRRGKNKGAGVRTHAMVSVGSAMTMIVSQFILVRYPEFPGDIFRLGAGVVSGVGFLGAGTIIVGDRNKVHGLTTAAGLWTCACIGLAAGAGFVEGTLVAMLAAWLILHNLTTLDHKLVKHALAFELYVEFLDAESMHMFTNDLDERGVKYGEFVVQKSPLKGEGPVATLSVEVATYQDKKNLLKELKDFDGITYFELA